MLSREERILSEILASRGLVERATLESCARAKLAGDTGASLADLVRQSGVLDRARLAEAEAEAKSLDRALASVLPKDAKLGEFRVIREIGRGGMGIVYEAEQESLGRRVALKVLPAAATLDERRALRFLKEARAAARLHHSGIVPVHASGIAEGMLYFAMELIDGETVAEAIARGPLQADRAAAIAAEVARALAHAHEAGLVHRDIKPENILLDRGGHAKVADFGLVQDSIPGSLTLAHHVLGTPAYLAPEQALGKEVDARADVYALGAVLYTMLCGESPYPDEMPSAVIVKLVQEDPPALEGRRPDVPRPLVEICRRAMAREPRARYPSAESMAGALDAFLSGTLPTSEKAERVAPRAPWNRRVLLLSLLAGAALASVAVLVVLLRTDHGGSRAASTPAGRGVPVKWNACCSQPGGESCKRLDLDLSTGVDDSSPTPGPIAVDEPDGDWWVIAEPNSGPVPRPATVLSPHPRWKNLPGSRWISSNVFGRNGLYVYETCFCVPPGVRDPILDLSVLGDDAIASVRFNQRSFPIPTDPNLRCVFDRQPCRLVADDPAWFVPGRNCLVVEVENAGGSPNGLQVSANVRGDF